MRKAFTKKFNIRMIVVKMRILGLSKYNYYKEVIIMEKEPLRIKKRGEDGSEVITIYTSSPLSFLLGRNEAYFRF